MYILFSIVKHLESANTMFSFIWWIIGFYWISAGGQALSHDAPQLYWYALSSCGMWMIVCIIISGCSLRCLSYCPLFCRLSIVFLAFDVFFVVFCVALACVIGIAVCCCLPCIIAILYAVTDQVCQFLFRTDIFFKWLWWDLDDHMILSLLCVLDTFSSKTIFQMQLLMFYLCNLSIITILHIHHSTFVYSSFYIS